ncbi:MAG: hypothetical protein JNL64_09000 [Blastocatellia bacterium]|nr:hypothetical protein [Blastocatellia bacterium]
MQTIVRHLLLLVVVATVAVAACGFVRTRPVRHQPVDSWETILFDGYGEKKQGYDHYTKLMKLKPLREELKYPDEIEIRFWRGAYLSDSEMVVLKFTDGKWSGIHAKPEDPINFTRIKVTRLPVPRGGWEYFYAKLVEFGVYEVQTEIEETCRNRLDGILHLVEISKENVYRNAINGAGYENCDGSRKMDLIAEHIAVSFDDGGAECKTYEWFPCGKVSRESRLAEEKEKK